MVLKANPQATFLDLGVWSITVDLDPPKFVGRGTHLKSSPQDCLRKRGPGHTRDVPEAGTQSALTEGQPR